MHDERSFDDQELLRDLRLKRLQRGAEYALLTALHAFFLLAFREYVQVWMVVVLASATFVMNFRLTQLREARRTGDPNSRTRVRADAFESILFLLLVVIIALGSLGHATLGMSDQEYRAYTAALLGGIFLAGFSGELYWQARHYASLDAERRRNYVVNLKRTIILPYTIERRRR